MSRTGYRRSSFEATAYHECQEAQDWAFRHCKSYAQITVTISNHDQGTKLPVPLFVPIIGRVTILGSDGYTK